MAPAWSPVKALFVPLTEPQMQELLHADGVLLALGFRVYRVIGL